VKIFCTHPDWTWDLPNLLYNGYRSPSQRKSGWDMVLTTHLCLVVRLKKEQIYIFTSFTPHPPPPAFLACYRVNFNFMRLL
jgi:hypothetical protein